jgi:pimeloyl-ACP methyl ester carboxylesterase
MANTSPHRFRRAARIGALTALFAACLIAGCKPGSGTELHIYLEGDGRIWRNPEQLFADPTPPRSLVLQLLQQDPAPALFIGRPCYFSVTDPQCAPHWWTAARYSQAVVDSVAAVAARWAQPYADVVLIGYSGGGALAVLMAPQLAQTRAVVTLAGNLDTAQWVQHHRYSEEVIGASLNPAAQAPLPQRVAQWHYAGGADDNVLWPWIAAYSARQHGAHFIRHEQFDHHCCWVQQWPALLAKIDQNSRR